MTEKNEGYLSLETIDKIPTPEDVFKGVHKVSDLFKSFINDLKNMM